MRSYDEFVKIAKPIERDEYGFPKKPLGRGYVAKKTLSGLGTGAAAGLMLGAPSIVFGRGPVLGMTAAGSLAGAVVGKSAANSERARSLATKEQRAKYHNLSTLHGNAIKDLEFQETKLNNLTSHYNVNGERVPEKGREKEYAETLKRFKDAESRCESTSNTLRLLNAEINNNLRKKRNKKHR